MTDELKIAMVDAERDVLQLSLALDAIEAKEATVVTILGEAFEITPEFYNEPIGVFIQSAYDRKSETHLIKYLKQKYEAFQLGIPVEYVNDELLFEDEDELHTFMCSHFGGAWKRKKAFFVPFELVADHVINCGNK